MKAVEFCYWLQGFFEVADPVVVVLNEVHNGPFPPKQAAVPGIPRC